jgi:predicted 2-oxoglutarate/Fe(II)-dependent dioxygenase YbiX
MVEVIPGIYVARAFSPAEAAAVVATAAAATDWSAAGINAGQTVDPSVRSADVLFESSQPALVAGCRDRLFAATSRLASALAPKTVLAELQIVRYGAGGRYIDHRDSPAPGATPRALSVVCYLNDDFTGGATSFPEREFAFQPWAGMALIFAPELLHRAEAVVDGMKYAITAWYHVPPARRSLTAEVQAEHELWESVLEKEHAGHEAVRKGRA